MKKFNKNTRAGETGKFIVCPECRFTEKVYHFAWSTLRCVYCKKAIVKTDWLIDEICTRKVA